MVAGVFGAVPALVLHALFVPHLPGISSQSLPTLWLLDAMAFSLAQPVYFVVLFGTLIMTAVGVLQGVNERTTRRCAR